MCLRKPQAETCPPVMTQKQELGLREEGPPGPDCSQPAEIERASNPPGGLSC